MAEYAIRAPHVVHETLDGEVIAIDFDSGRYYSLRGPAEAVWSALAAGEAQTAEAVAAVVRRRHPGDGEPGPVATFLDLLVEEDLLVRRGPPAGTPGAALGALAFERYADMEELILLDPVHDVSEAGWPNAAT